MNRISSIQTNSIAENCRSILRERYCNHIGRLNAPSRQECPPSASKPCYSIPTNPIHSLYDVDNLRVPIMRCEEPSYCNTLLGLSSAIPANNYIRQPTCMNRNIGCISIPSENCIQMITNAIVTRIRCKIPQDEVVLLCCCLPSLIRQMMCKSPWLTPNDIIQCLTADIIKEAAHCFDLVDSNVKNDFHKPKDRLPQPRKDNTFEDHRSQEDDDDSSSSNQNTTTGTSQHSSQSILDVLSKDKNKQKYEEKENKSRTPSTRSFTSQQSKTPTSDSHHSLVNPSWSVDDRSQKSDRNTTPVHLEDDARSFTSNDKGIPTYDSLSNPPNFYGDFDGKSTDLTPKSESISRIHLDYPGRKDPTVIRDVENCLAFYQKMREYFDDDVAAMLLKCCLCYGDCSGKK